VGAQLLGRLLGRVALLAQPRACLGRPPGHHPLVEDQGPAAQPPQVDWVRGQRYIQDGTITTTAGVTSGVFGALRLVQQLAGAAEAQRVGRELAYPGWSLDGPTAIPAQAAGAA